MSDVRFEQPVLLIDGQLSGAAGDRVYDNINPATEEVLGVAADGTAADMDEAIGAARRAFDESTWSTDVDLRVRGLRQLREAFDRHLEEIRALTVAEVGCPVMLTGAAQLDVPVTGISWVADLVEGYEWIEDLGESEIFGITSHRYVYKEATGVVGAITPWNFPHQINLAKVVPALAAGNTVVLKPAPDTPWSASILARLVAEETDIPAGVLNVVTSSDHAVGAQLTEDPRVDLVSFTGSTATGRKIMQAGAPTIKKLFLELGGKSAFIALDDADLATAAAGAAFQVTAHAGQGCAITSRLLVPRGKEADAIDAVVETMSAFACGDPTDPATMVGPLIREGQRQRVLGYIEKGKAQGATVALGGGVPADFPKGYYVEPTVLTGVSRDDTVAQEEIFGPVLAVLAHDGDDDAVAIANDSIYGLSGAVLSADLEHARAVAKRVRTGTLSVNGGVYYGPDVPFGGYRQSGVGREMGVAGFEEYLELKSIAEGV
jgi:aldehyde dehydrogenase (NAD+)